MSELIELLLEYIVSELETREIPLDREGSTLRLPSLACIVSCSQTHLAGLHEDLAALLVKVDEEAFPIPLEDTIAAVGKDADAKARHAARIWSSGFFDPFHASRHGFQGDNALELVTANARGEPQAWKAYTQGPMSTGGGAGASFGRMELMRRFVAELGVQLNDRHKHALKCYVAKTPGPIQTPGDRVHASCEFDGREWMEGLSHLLYLADEWGEVKVYESRRQWFFFDPVEPGAIPEAWERITGAPAEPRALKVPRDKPWWKIW